MQNHDPADKIPWWGYCLALFGIVLVTTGAMIGLFRPELLVSPKAQISDGVRIYAGYMAARNLAIASVLVVIWVARAQRYLALMFAFLGLVQILDAIIDLWEKRWPIVPGVLILGIVFMIGGYRLFRLIALSQRESRSAS